MKHVLRLLYIYKLAKLTTMGRHHERYPPWTIFRQLYFSYYITNDPLAIYISPVSSPEPSHTAYILLYSLINHFTRGRSTDMCVFSFLGFLLKNNNTPLRLSIYRNTVFVARAVFISSLVPFENYDEHGSKGQDVISSCPSGRIYV